MIYFKSSFQTLGRTRAILTKALDNHGAIKEGQNGCNRLLSTYPSESNFGRRSPHCLRLSTQARAASTSSSLSSFEKLRSDDIKYCIENVKKFEFDNYLCGLVLPEDARISYFALRAFNIETATVKEVAKGNVAIAEMRLQFWRDVIADIYKGKVRNIPLAQVLAHSIKTHKLTKRWFDRIIDTRQTDLDGIQPLDMDELETYVENTASSMLYLSLESLGVRNAQADHAASHIGKSIGLTILLKGTSYHANQNTVYIPLDLTRKHNITIDDLRHGPMTAENQHPVAEIFFEVSSRAHSHLEHAREMKNKLPPKAHYAFLPAIGTRMYLDDLEKCGWNIYDDRLQLKKNHLWFQLRLMWSNFRQEF